MYIELPHIKQPDNDVVIWRYMDFAKSVSLLDKRALFFVRVDRLADPFEGFYPAANAEFPDIPDSFSNVKALLLELSKYVRKCTAVSCWHVNEYESAAMWSAYLPENKGIALKSSFERLKESFKACSERAGTGMLEYIDHHVDRICNRSLLALCMCKRRSYEHERELRALILRLGAFPSELRFEDAIKWFQSHPGAFDKSLGGLYVQVCLDELIEKVYLSPRSPG